MVRKFLFFLFDSFILVVIFISLFQFSASNMNLGGFEKQFSSDNYFGFQSLLTFATDLGNNTNIITAWNDGINWFTRCMRYIWDNLVDFWETATGAKGLGNNPFTQMANAFKLIYILLSAPIVLLLGIGGILTFVIRLAWELVSLFFKLLMGYYNTPVRSVTPSMSFPLVRVYSF